MHVPKENRASPLLVTGATGNIGGALVQRLLTERVALRALVRSVDRARRLLPDTVELVEGDITQPASLGPAMSGVGTVIHAAGLPEQWTPDPGIFERVNVEGAKHVADAALEAGVHSFIHVSTIDVFVWNPGQPFGEIIDPNPKATAYERSKQAADHALTERMPSGLPVRFACPSGVFGPAPALTPGLNQLLADLLGGTLPMLLPGGVPLVFNDDVAVGLIRLLSAPIGTRAIFSGPYLTLREIAQRVQRIASNQLKRSTKVPRVAPLSVARIVSRVGECLAGLGNRANKAPLIPAGALHFLAQHVVPDASFARDELGWCETPLDTSFARTLEWLLAVS